MTTKRVVQGLIVAVALCLGATAGRAQNNRVFLLGSGSSFMDNRSFTEGFVPYSTTYANGGGGIVGIEVPLKKSKTFGVELSYGLSQNNLKLANDAYTYKPVTAYALRNNRVSLDLVLHAPGTYHGTHPYLVFGLEYNDFSPTSAATTLGTKIGFAFEPTAKFSSQGSGGANLGGGLDHNLTARLGLRLDIRAHFTGSPTFGLPTTEPSTAGLAWFPATGNAHNIVYSIGIVYKFGK